MTNADMPAMPTVQYWIAKRKTHSVEVKAWHDGVKWHWNVYAYVFESHPRFNDNEWIMNLPFHGGCTFDQQRIVQPIGGCRYDFQATRKVKVAGSDYNHICDDYENHPSPFDCVPGFVPNPFRSDADALLAELDKEGE
jgi:hypothetical protein